MQFGTECDGLNGQWANVNGTLREDGSNSYRYSSIFIELYFPKGLWVILIKIRYLWFTRARIRLVQGADAVQKNYEVQIESEKDQTAVTLLSFTQPIKIAEHFRLDKRVRHYFPLSSILGAVTPSNYPLSVYRKPFMMPQQVRQRFMQSFLSARWMIVAIGINSI